MVVHVSINHGNKEVRVGSLILSDRLIYFQYSASYLEQGFNLSPIKLRFDGSLQLAKADPFHGIFGVFDDSLPDGWGMLLLHRALEKQGLTINDINILDQLAFVGESGKGALIYRPAIENNEHFEGKIDLDHLKSSINEVYEGSGTEIIEKLFNLGGSSGGARPKANVGFNPQTNQLCHSHNMLSEGFEHWIIKFPSSHDLIDIGNIEFAYYKMAIAAGIDMSECRLLASSTNQQFFATKRFDRAKNKHIHMHSMAGLVHDNYRRSAIDYGHIIDTAFTLENTATARREILRLAAFNVFGHNMDDHSKNFSWLMDHQGKWKFAPAYDLTFSSTAVNEHSTTIDGEGARPGKKQLLALADHFSITKPNEIIEQVQSSIAMWPDFAQECGVGKSSTQLIQNTLSRISKY